MSAEAIIPIQRHLKAVLSKRPGWAAGLWGEAGVGKTFTVQTLLRQTPIRSLSLPATLSEKEMARRFPDPTRLPAWTAGQLERLSRGQSVETQALADAVASALSVSAPFVLHVEDIHEASPERLELIRKLAGIVPRLRGVGLLVTSRSEPSEPFKSYRLEPLGKTASDALLEAQAQVKLPPEGLDWVFARARGNALFTLEFWRYLLRQGFFWSDGQNWRWRAPPEDFVPVSVEALISQMLSELPSEPRQILEARAMLPDESEFFDPLWANAAGIASDTLTQAQRVLEARGILQGGFFAHPLFREVVRHETPPEHQQTYARRALGALENDPQTAALFIDAAGLGGEERQVRFQQAAAAAEAQGRVVEAGRWLARATEDAQGSSRAALAHRAARHLSGVEPPEAIRLLEITVSEEPSNTEAVILLATNYARLGLVAELTRTLERLPDDATAQSYWVKSLLMIRNGQRDHRGVVALWNDHPELHADPDPLTAYRVGFAYMELDDPDKAEALAFYTLQRPDLTSLHKMMLLSVCGLARRLRGDLETARSFLDEALVYARANGPANLASCLHNRQIVLQMLGLYSDAVSDLREAMDLYRSAGITLNYSSTLTSLGGLLGGMGQYEEAEAKLLEAHQNLSRFDVSGFLCSNESALCELYLSWRPPHGLTLAQKYAQLLMGHARTLEPRYLGGALCVAASVANELGQPERGQGLADECLQLDQVNAEVRTKAFLAKAAALEKLGLIADAIHTLESARSLSISEFDRQRVSLEHARLCNEPVAARASLEWFGAHGLMGMVQVALKKWPELASDPSESPVAQAVEHPPVRLNVLGLVNLEREGQSIAYRGKKRLEILCYLLEARIAGKYEVDVLELMDIFYPEMPEAQAKATLRQQIYLIRGGLGAESVLSTPNGYTLGALRSDAEEFLSAGDTQLWRGAYLHGLGEGWSVGVREALTLALRQGAENLISTDAKEAERLGHILLEMEPYDPEVLQLTLRALYRQGNIRAAERVYQQAQTRMLEVGEQLPLHLGQFIGQGFVSR